MSITVAIIGAGSVIFGQRLVTDILFFDELKDARFQLMDIDPERLQVGEKLLKKTIAQMKVPAQVTATLDRKEALKGADFVINMIQVGGFEATLVDFNIPEKYGIRQTIADTHGIGGIFRGLRTIPVVVDMCREMEEVCPDALLINYSNPMAMNVWAAYRATGVKVVGLCHSVQHTAETLASYIGADTKDISFVCAGINHVAWYLVFRHKGKDAYPDLFRAMENPEIFRKNPVRFEIMRRFGYFVTESSEHMAEYVPYFMRDEELIKRYDIPVREYVKRCEDLLDEYEQAKKLADSDDPVEIARSPEYCALIIHSMTTNTVRTINGNVENRGVITNLPQGCCVEVPCMVDSNGVRPVVIGDLPPQLAALDRLHINVQELTVRAALERKKDYIYQAALVDPLTTSFLGIDQIYSLVDDLIEAHGDLLPAYR